MDGKIDGKRVLVTGGCGSIGSRIVLGLLAGNANVIVFDREEVKHFVMRKQLAGAKFKSVVGDIRDRDSLERVFACGIDEVYHVAAVKHVVMCQEYPAEVVRVNVEGTQNVVDMAVKYGCSRFIGISTDKAAAPSCVMGASKLIAETVVINGNEAGKGIFSCVRFGNVANAYGSVIPVYVDDMVHRRVSQVTDPDVTRFLMRIEDAASLSMKAMRRAEGREVFVLKMKAFRLGDLVQVMKERIAGILPGVTWSFAETGLMPGEKMHEELVSEAEMPYLHLDNEMYILKRHCPPAATYNHGQVRSDTADKLTQDELEAIILEYLVGTGLERTTICRKAPMTAGQQVNT